MVIFSFRNVMLSLVFLLFFFCLFFYNAFFSYVGGEFLKSYTLSKFGQPLTFTEAYFIDSKLILLEPSSQGKVSFKAHSLIFSFGFDLLQGKAGLTIAFNQPVWSMEEPFEGEKEGIVNLLERHRASIAIDPIFLIEKGLIQWKSRAGLRDQIGFNLSYHNQRGGELSVQFADHHHLPSRLQLKALNDPLEGFKVIFSCNNVNCPSFFTLLSFFNQDFTPFNVHEGTLQGKVIASFPLNRRPLFEGELNLEKFHFIYGDSAFEGGLDHGRFLLAPNHALENSQSLLPCLIGRVECLTPAFFKAKRWSIEQITGSIQLEDTGKLLFDLSSDGKLTSYQAKWEIEGYFYLNPKKKTEMLLNAFSLDKGSSLSLSMRQTKRENKKVEAKFNLLTFEDFTFLEEIVRTLTTDFAPLPIRHKGLKAELCLEFDKKGRGRFSIPDFYMNELALSLEDSKLLSHFKKVSGKANGRIGYEHFTDYLSTEMHFQQGSLLSQDSPRLSCRNFSIDLSIIEGEIVDSKAFIESDLFRGILKANWGKKAKVIEADLQGELYTLFSFLPASLQKRFEEKNKNRPCALSLHLDGLEKEWKNRGVLEISPESIQDPFSKIEFNLEGPELLFNRPLSDHFQGSFYSKGLSAEAFLSPLLFKRGGLTLSGRAEIRGVLSKGLLKIDYNLLEPKIESKELLIRSKNLTSPQSGGFLGHHELELSTLSHRGFLPIEQASYLQKNKELLFEEIEGVLEFQNEEIKINTFEAQTKGIFLKGGLNFDYSDPRPGVFNLSLCLPLFSGKISQLRSLVRSLEEHSLFCRLPLEGLFSSRKKGMTLAFQFLPDGYEVVARASGVVFDGLVEAEGFKSSLKGLSMDFDYDHQEKELNFSNLEGTLLIGKAKELEEYECRASYLRFRDFSDPEISCDVAINREGREWVRVLASSRSQGNKRQKIELDQTLSHFGPFYPTTWECTVDEWKRLEAFHFSSSFDLDKFLSDFQNYQRKGFLAPLIQSKLSSPILGKGSLEMGLDPIDSSYLFDVKGFYQLEEEKSGVDFSFFGKKREGKWMIEDLNWGGWHLYGEFEPLEDRCKIPFLGISLNEALLVGLEAELFPDCCLLNTKIKMGELHLEQEPFKTLLGQLGVEELPRGFLKFSGDFEWAMNDSKEGWLKGIKGRMKVESPQLLWGGWSCHFKKPFFIHFSKESNPQISSSEIKGEIHYKTKRVAFHEGSFCLLPNLLTFSLLDDYNEIKLAGDLLRPSLKKGVLQLFEVKNKQASPLVIGWNYEGEKFLIERVEGSIGASSFNLRRTLSSEPEKNQLFGSALLLFPDFNRFCGEGSKGYLDRFNIKTNCRLDGKVTLDIDGSKTLGEGLFFQGQIHSDYVEITGNRVNNLRALVNYSPGRLEIEKLKVEDPAGRLNIETFIAKFDEEKRVWNVFSPLIQLNNFKFDAFRTNKPIKKEKYLTKLRSFLIKKIQFENFFGEIENRASWKARGSLEFDNGLKKTNLNPLFAVPGELFLRLGLDPQVMSPVGGTIFFDLEGNRFYLRKFKDVFSQGKGSKFYLDSESPPSWIDMDGKLSLHLRTKQYNLIFKMIEPFTLSIQGSCLKPNYNFHRQGKLHKESQKGSSSQ